MLVSSSLLFEKVGQLSPDSCFLMEIGLYSSNVAATGQARILEDEEEALRWVALERLPTYDRARKCIFHGVNGELKEVDLQKLGYQERRELLNWMIKSADNNEEFLQKLKNRIDRVSLNFPTIEIRFENLNVKAEAYVGKRALPSVFNFFINFAEMVASQLHILPSQKKKFSTLRDVSGIIKPGRMTLLLGRPGSGKTVLLQALSGKLESDLKFSGEVTYNGQKMNKFIPQRTCAYISQYDIHFPLLTVRETLAFSARCQGVGNGYDMLTELLRREKELNIKPDPYIDALMKASVSKGHKEDIVTEYILKILGLDVCADTIVGNEMVRGISGGQRKRVTTGEMLVGPVNAFLMDNISTGLDSSTTFQIVNSIRQSTHILNKSALISLLQPPPEIYELFDDIILISDGQIVYQGPRQHVLEFFGSVGFKCPENKGVADYLLEVTSIDHQCQYWMNEERPYHYISVDEFVKAFKSFHVGRAIHNELSVPFESSKSHPAALTRTKYGANKRELMKACLSREIILTKRSINQYIFKIAQLEICAAIVATVFMQVKNQHNNVDDGVVYLGALYFTLNAITFTGMIELPTTINKLAVFYKQRDLFFYPPWAFSIASSILAIPLSLIEVVLWVGTTYYSIGFDAFTTRLLKHFLILAASGQMSYALFRCIGSVTRDHTVSNTIGCLAILWLTLFGGFVLSRENMPVWLIGGYWTSPLMYAQTALSANEFLGENWNHVVNGSKEALGISVLKSRGLFTDPHWFWIALVALIGFVFLLNGINTLALAYLNEYGKFHAVFPSDEKDGEEGKAEENGERSTKRSFQMTEKGEGRTKPGQKMRLPYIPLSITFENIRYSVDLPKAMKSQGFSGDRLELLKGVSGAFRPGILTALMGVSGAGKTTLLDVLAGRKNSGCVQGNITVCGYPKRKQTFTRICGYCEQIDIHSPFVTVYESLIYSAWLRLPREVDQKDRELFVEEVMGMIELIPLRDALVGFPNVNGLSIGQRKRLTIAVELVANPSIIFMDEPTSGLDSKAAYTVMKIVRNIVDTGRTVVCTIHQPSSEIFESFDELFLLTRGGEEIYVGPLGPQSCHLIKYFEDIHGVSKFRDGTNPATWALEVTTRAQEDDLGIQFADIYRKSDLSGRNRALIQELSSPAPDSKDIIFPTKYPQSYLIQFKACLWKQHKSYWRNTSYNAVRIVFTTSMAVIFGVVFLGLGSHRGSKQDIFNGIGSMYSAILFMGFQSASTIRPIIINDRAVQYRERAAGMYSALPYAVAQVAIEIPYTFFQVAVFAVIVYTMMGYALTATKFFLNLFFIFITIIYNIYYGMMVVALSPNHEIAILCTSILNTMWNLFSGFVIPRTKMEVWWRWYSWICPISWSLYGMAALQYADVEKKLDTGETVEEFMKDYFGFEYDMLWVVSMALIGFTLLFALVFAFSTKAMNFQRR